MCWEFYQYYLQTYHEFMHLINYMGFGLRKKKKRKSKQNKTPEKIFWMPIRVDSGFFSIVH